MPIHSAVAADRAAVVEVYGNLRFCAPVKCPSCSLERWVPITTLNKWIDTSNSFDGSCRRCATPKMRAAWQDMLRRKPRAAAHITTAGYRAVPLHCVPDEHQWIWKKLHNKSTTVLEHRMVYSIHLGRPLQSNECVDHMNGDKLDNRVENLRIYLKGANQVGSSNGYGTYYDEWQRAEAKIRRLESELSALRGER